MSKDKRAVLVDVAQYVIVVAALGAFFAVLIIRSGHITTGRGLFMRALMWSPGAAALLLMRRRGISWREIGWTWTGRWEWICYASVLGGGILVYALAWMAGFVVFPDPAAVSAIIDDFGWHRLPASVVVVGYGALMMTLGMLPAVMNALGEEIGWRGYLVPRLATQFNFTSTALLSGVIWAAWHYPMFMLGDYYRGGDIWFAILCFTALILAASVITTYLRLKSGSIWPAVMIHATNNLFVQDVMRTLTGHAKLSQYTVDQFGGLLPLFAIAVAFMVWRRRADLEGLKLQPVAQEAEPATFSGLRKTA